MCAYVKMIQLVVLCWYMTEPLLYFAGERDIAGNGCENIYIYFGQQNNPKPHTASAQEFRRRRTVRCIPLIALRLNLRLKLSPYEVVATLLVVAMTSLQPYSYRTLTSEEQVRGSNAKLMVVFNIVLFLLALPCWC